MRVLLQQIGVLATAMALYQPTSRNVHLATTRIGALTSAANVGRATAATEKELLSALENVSGRGRTASLEVKLEIELLIAELEEAGLSQKRNAQELEGVWRLLYTSTPGNTQSPIQKSLTGYDGVSIYQVLNLRSERSFLGGGLPDVSNTVVFGNGQARLRVTALASTASRVLVEPRIGDGSIFGLTPFGKSFNRPPRNAQERIDFSFQEAMFEFSEPFAFSIPYPVPFKLLGDEAKGYIDNTYYSENFRVARGNKGTIFLLQKANVATDAKAAAAAALKLSPPPKPAPSSSAKKPKGERPQAIILFPSQLGTMYDYDDFQKNVQKESNLKMYITPLERLDWPLGLVGSFFTKEFIEGRLEPSKTLAFYFRRVDEAVEQALAENPTAELVLLSHSIGGWVARAWLSEWASSEVKERVRVLISMGSPHNAPPSDSGIDQTRGLLTYINTKFPGSHEKNVKYVSVIGRAVRGGVGSVEGNFAERFLAYSSYSVLCGDGGSEGDGIIPIATATLAGAENIVIDNARHSNFIPTPFRQSIFLSDDTFWYGSPSVLGSWLGAALL